MCAHPLDLTTGSGFVTVAQSTRSVDRHPTPRLQCSYYKSSLLHYADKEEHKKLLRKTYTGFLLIKSFERLISIHKIILTLVSDIVDFDIVSYLHTISYCFNVNLVEKIGDTRCFAE